MTRARVLQRMIIEMTQMRNTSTSDQTNAQKNEISQRCYHKMPVQHRVTDPSYDNLCDHSFTTSVGEFIMWKTIVRDYNLQVLTIREQTVWICTGTGTGYHLNKHEKS